MNLLVDTSAWSLALRRDSPRHWAVESLSRALRAGDGIFTTGLILQEILQGFEGPKARQKVLDSFGSLPFLVPDRQDYIDAAELRNSCRRKGVQIGTIDALLAQLAIRHDLSLLTADGDFDHIAKLTSLQLVR